MKYIWFVKCWFCKKKVLAFIEKSGNTCNGFLEENTYLFHNASKCKKIKNETQTNKTL